MHGLTVTMLQWTLVSRSFTQLEIIHTSKFSLDLVNSFRKGCSASTGIETSILFRCLFLALVVTASGDPIQIKQPRHVSPSFLATPEMVRFEVVHSGKRRARKDSGIICILAATECNGWKALERARNAEKSTRKPLKAVHLAAANYWAEPIGVLRREWYRREVPEDGGNRKERLLIDIVQLLIKIQDVEFYSRDVIKSLRGI